MKTDARLSLFAVVSTVFLFVLVISPPARAANVSFDQISWGDGPTGNPDPDSQWGQANVSFSPADAASLTSFGSGYMGWLNIVTSVGGGSNNNWAVQNEPVVFDTASELGAELPISYYFNLGQTDGVAVNNLSYSLTLSPTELSSEPGGPLTSVAVLNAAESQGTTTNAGYEGDQDDAPAQDSEGAGVPGATAAMAGRGGIATTTTNIPVVAEQINGCAPGAAARSIAYLGMMFPSLNVTQSAQQIYGTLTNYMSSSTGTNPITGATNSTGTLPANFVAGKNLYFTTNNLSIAPTVVTNSFAAVISALNSTGDVELGVNWGPLGGGHCVFVSGVTTLYTNGLPYRYVVSVIQDPNQGGNSTNNQSLTYTFDTSGRMISPVAGGGVNSFRIELATIPEPSSLVMAALGLGALGLSFVYRRRKRKHT